MTPTWLADVGFGAKWECQMAGRNPRNPVPPTINDLIADPIVQLTMRADGVDEAELRELLRAAGWKLATSRSRAEQPATLDGVQALNEYRVGVGVMLVNKARHVFVGRRIDVADEAWQMPQGGIELGEEPIHAALRELREEIGTAKVKIIAESTGWHKYDLPSNLQGRAWHGRWRGQLQKWFVMRFVGQDSEINVHTTVPEFSAWKWVPSEDLPKIVAEFKRQLYIDLLAEFGAKHL
jgi:putative (di)nucleoside polyphosphate hydrolase